MMPILCVSSHHSGSAALPFWIFDRLDLHCCSISANGPPIPLEEEDSWARYDLSQIGTHDCSDVSYAYADESVVMMTGVPLGRISMNEIFGFTRWAIELVGNPDEPDPTL